MGAGYFDYILVDHTIVPEDQCEVYSEQCVWLPDSYQVNDSSRRISAHAPTRRQCDLPETGFVFCCFNNTYKITPQVFDIWMRILHATEGSILWLFRDQATAEANLRREAAARGIDPARLVFAGKAPPEHHLTRYRLADLFLDTLPYNAHTTASDALWSGLPVLTCLGSTFAGRVAGSLLNAVGLPELIAPSLDRYESAALNIARDSNLLTFLTAKISRNRDTCPLFDTRRFTRHIEAAYVTMWERYQRGEIPKSFSVKPIQ